MTSTPSRYAISTSSRFVFAAFIDPGRGVGSPGGGNRMFGTCYVRFQAVDLDRHGIRPGVFALVKGLVFDGGLTDAQERFRRDTNAWFTRSYTDPAAVVPDIYSHQTNPSATSWFKVSAVHLLERVEGYLELLRAHAVDDEVVCSTQPGRIIYEDADQIVAAP